MRLRLLDFDVSRCTGLNGGDTRADVAVAGSRAAAAKGMTASAEEDGVDSDGAGAGDAEDTSGSTNEGAAGGSGSALSKLARAMAQGGGVRGNLLMSSISMGDDKMATFFTELTRAPRGGQLLLMTHLDLSRNLLRAGFVTALSAGLPHCAQLTSLRSLLANA